MLAHVGDAVTDRDTFRSRGQTLTPHRLADRGVQQQRDDETRSTGQNEHDLPGRKLAEHRQDHRRSRGHPRDDGATDEIGHAHARRDAHVEEGDRAILLGARKVIRDQRIRGRRQRGLAEADAKASCGELAEALRESAADGHRAPERHGQRDQAAPVVPIRKPAERQPHRDVEDREPETHQQTHLRVADAEVCFHRADQQREDPAIEQRDRVGDRQQDDDIPGVGAGRIGRFGLGGHRKSASLDASHGAVKKRR